MKTCKQYDRMCSHWQLINDLLGGTEAMRAAGPTWLPKESKEKEEMYKVRLDRSILFNGYKDTIRKLVSKPFSHPVTIDNSPIEGLEYNIDQQGTDITQFARDMFESGIIYGLTHVLIDFPRSMIRTYDQEQVIVPNWIHIRPPDLVYWKTIIINGHRELIEIHFKQCIVIEAGDEEKEITELHIYTKDTWEVRQENDGEWITVDSGLHTYGAIPIITFYTLKTGYMVGDPPLEDLAWLNLAHWQSFSDQRNILRFARAGVLFGAGFAEGELDSLTVGPNAKVSAANENAKLNWVEHTGRAIEAGANDIDKLEQRMETLGMQPLIARSARSTATGKIIDESRAHTDIQAWIRSLENTLREGFEVSAKWKQMELPEDFKVDIFSDFAVGLDSSNIGELIQLSELGKITHSTLLHEIKRRGVLAESVDVDVEIATIQAENPLENTTEDE